MALETWLEADVTAPAAARGAGTGVVEAGRAQEMGSAAGEELAAVGGAATGFEVSVGVAGVGVVATGVG